MAGKIHLIPNKEALDPDLLEGKIAVVFDVLLATTTMVTVMEHGAKEVIPALNDTEAHRLAAERDIKMIAGEFNGRTVDGFLDPSPTDLKDKIEGQRLVLSTTNGTVAIRKSQQADHIYIGSLLNAQRLAQHMADDHKDKTILLVCAGSGGTFALEDFYGAGCFLYECIQAGMTWRMTDAALSAYMFYDSYKNTPLSVLRRSRLGRLMVDQGYGHELEWAAQVNQFQGVHCFADGQMIDLQRSNRHV
ncbi:2-phosphosulfolactate phosphatase [Tuberibacillus sp. Marseille-P3662]|uniref:2-phosphosulfolactate phosphatase n=1 Tax=Tuberibacillus sp. Marseille-P3662 TaxID=1965358 RepID=UPI000A1C9A28|nr:2-phosphosulfolactate phosphatase [Tuberibacillus sp. Marseille-P3662]